MVAEFLIVTQQASFAAIGDQEHIQISVSVDIGNRGTASYHGLLEICTGLLRIQRDKLSRLLLARVPEQLARLLVLLGWEDLLNLGFQMAIGA